MGVDSSYGSGYKNTGLKKPVSPRAASARLRRKGVRTAAKKYTNITTSKAKSIPGTSSYVQQENAARAQLGTAGVAARARQFPKAARATLREVTGIDVSRKGVSVDPVSLAMALPVGKVLKAAKALRLAGAASKATPLANRLVAKSLGKDAARLIAQNQGATNSFIRENVIANAKKVRNLSAESVFPRGPKPGPFTKRGYGKVDQQGLEKMITGGREPSREMLRIPQILKATNTAYENIAQKAIKARNLKKAK